MKRRIFKWYRRRKILAIAEAGAFDFSDVDSLGNQAAHENGTKTPTTFLSR
jgi:hypothetical protein